MKTQSKTDQQVYVEFIVQLVTFLIISTLVWVVLHFIFLLSVTWLQVVGSYFLAGVLKHFFTN